MSISVENILLGYVLDIILYFIKSKQQIQGDILCVLKIYIG